jgi:RHS repeat-associated protein
VEKSNGTTGTLYWYMSPGIVAESDLNGNLQSEYVFFDGERVARKDFPGSAVSYYFSDHLKTTDIVTDAQGNIKNESDFYPWGGELQFLANDSNHYKFTGKERDSETGLDYFGARYYSNGLGRFISADWSATPIPVPYADFSDPQSLNLYGYVRGLPTTKADIDGHGFWRKLWNSQAFDGCWCEDADLKKHQAAEATKRQEAKEHWEKQHPGESYEKYRRNTFMHTTFDFSPFGELSFGAEAFEVGEVSLSTRPVWARTAGGFVNWLKNLGKAGTKLTAKEADEVIAEAKNLGVEVRLDPPHPGTDWNVPHLNIGKEGQVHLEVPQGYSNPSVPTGSATKP